ncbi:MAG: glycosyltransferase family 39 protein [Candidatus Omnitrophica bacterium]|nr:glycosyltransferase family 39 protein [Candidatus Omnitrophota bacterium]
MITYANADEGWFMDTLWYYYAGVERPSFRIASIYGLVEIYILWAVKLVLSKFMAITPSVLVLIVRWIYLFSWIGALIALWRLVGRHFGRGWQQVLLVSILATRPAYAYLLNNLKPDGLVLMFMLLGLDYTLRIIDRPRFKFIVIACVFASLALITKYVGPFLLPAMVTALYIVKRYRYDNRSVPQAGMEKIVFTKHNAVYAIPFLTGLMIIGLVFGVILFYVRQSTGATLYARYGAMGALLAYRSLLYAAAAGVLAMFVSPLMIVLARSRNELVRNAMDTITEIMSYALVLLAVFLTTSLVIGFGWLVRPAYFLMTYVPLGYCTVGMGAITKVAAYGFFKAYLGNIVQKITAFNPALFVLFLFYLAVEVAFWKKNAEEKSPMFFKRLTLVGFLLLPLGIMVSMVWMSRHHMLPFYTVAAILGIQGIVVFNGSFRGSRLVKRLVIFSVCALCAFDIGINAWGTVRSRLGQYRQHEDVAYEVRQWFRENIPETAVIVAAPYHYVYIPPEYERVRIFQGFKDNKFSGFKNFIDAYRPEFIYYNEGASGSDPLPFTALSDVLPGERIELVGVFESKGRPYRRFHDDKFVVYRVRY